MNGPEVVPSFMVTLMTEPLDGAGDVAVEMMMILAIIYSQFEAMKG